ncbi:Septin-interacting protein 1 [Eumeta japonica]|uniref:Septin-interacting protein 1 n=1 Tax=Eumeta variegata TaxID=151549 RepID=A0A4C2A9M1_EUMVA|nr:Septin-interacting protein 1 [Eumeta japonica]
MPVLALAQEKTRFNGCGPAGTSDESGEESPKPKPQQMQQKPLYKHKPRIGSVGAWKQHTRGDSNCYYKMGYKPGKGLGKDLQGISQPVEGTFARAGVLSALMGRRLLPV